MRKINNSKEFAAQVNELLELNDVQKQITKLSEIAFNSGMMETENLDADSYGEAKAVLHVIFLNLAHEFKPFTDGGKELSNNLKKII